jgi:nitric oxide reductase NorD protein
LGELPEATGGPEFTTTHAPVGGLNQSTTTIATEIEGQGQAEVRVLPAKDDDGPGADLPMHTFEKVETLEEYNGLSRKSDDEDELDEHAEALSSLKMTQVIRSPERPRSIYRADVILDGLALEAADDGPAAGVPYPEWDWQRGEYRRDWCHVQESLLAGGKAGWAERTGHRHRELIRRLKRQFATLTSDWLRLRRQNAGSEFDLDALIHSEVERRTGHTPEERIYQERRRDLHDVAALVLLDASYSTDAWLDNRHVLELITETVFCVGEVLEDYVARFALAAFSSNTRRSCRFDVVKPFDAPWQTTRGNLGAIEPCGYTRIGPALRHAQERLLNERAARKIVILVTDGRPCDYDRYEGRYGIHDVKKAIETGKLHGIQTHAFAIEKQAAQAFPQMFTRHHFDILSRPEALAKTMCKLFARLLAD